MPFRFPNESDEYRARRDELLELEKQQRALGEQVAQRRRELPLGGRLKESYRFQRMDAQGQVHPVAFEELFGEHRSLLLYTMMFGPDWDAACPSCTSIVDAINSNYHPASQQCALAIVAAVATLEPDVAAKIADEPILACISPPGSHDSH